MFQHARKEEQMLQKKKKGSSPKSQSQMPGKKEIKKTPHSYLASINMNVY